MVQRIELTQGRFALVDDDDFLLMNSYLWRWSKSTSKSNPIGYAARNVKTDDATGRCTGYLLHRQLTGAKKGQVVIFRNSNTLDCQRSNLILGTRSQASSHGRLHKNSITQDRNISVQNGGTFVVRIKADKILHKETFDDIRDARRWAAAKRLELHGEACYLPYKDVRNQKEVPCESISAMTNASTTQQRSRARR